MINVTRAFESPYEEYEVYLRQIWKSGILTNQGPLLRQFESEVKAYLQLDNFQFIANGTLALQLAIRSFEFEKGEIITTPFSYVATTSAIMWEGFTPVFADIDPSTLCINPDNIEELITPETRAIIPVHVFGNTCEIEKIELIAKKHDLKVIYDAAHSFGVKYKGRSVFNYGDISTTSFHATKLFHTIEGGGIFTKDNEIQDKLNLMKRFGHNNDDHKMLGINAKASEFQAAMGLCNIKYINSIIENRKKVSDRYDKKLSSKIRKQINTNDHSNYAYYPILLNNPDEANNVKHALEHKDIFTRRYFYPSLNTLPYMYSIQKCPISEEIASQILCLPLYPGLDMKSVDKISEIINNNVC